MGSGEWGVGIGLGNENCGVSSAWSVKCGAYKEWKYEWNVQCSMYCSNSGKWNVEYGGSSLHWQVATSPDTAPAK